MDIVAGRFDVALWIGEVIQKDMIALQLSQELSQIAVASPDYLRRHGAPAHPRELAFHHCIGWRWPGHERVYAWEFYENGKWFEVEVSGPLISSTKKFGTEAAINGFGIAFIVREMAAKAIAAGSLVPLLEEWAGPFPGYRLYYPAQRQMAPALRAFVDAVCAYARG